MENIHGLPLGALLAFFKAASVLIASRINVIVALERLEFRNRLPRKLAEKAKKWDC
jgi:hypothetical protein